MNLNWMFGSTMEQRHLLYVYVLVWVLQFGYAGWGILRWKNVKQVEKHPDFVGEEEVRK